MSGTTDLITVADIAADLRVSAMTVTRWLKAGKIPALQVGRSWRIERGDYDAFLAASRNDASA
jgi:excisionase family DNA binding protein